MGLQPERVKVREARRITKAVADFHTHTFLSDGVLSPCELIRRAAVNGYQIIGITDHVGPGFDGKDS